MQAAINRAILVAKAGCARVGRQVGVGAVTTALALMLSIGGVGCSSSHTSTGVDRDGDGYTSDVDCDDSRADIYPGAPEVFGGECPPPPAVDYDCDGVPVTYTCNPFPDDFDGDGYDASIDCNDNDPNIYPGAPEGLPEDCCDDAPAVDRDCDGLPPICTCNPFPDDFDGDGYPAAEDCDDEDPLTYPGAPEDECEGIDRNCDGEIALFICNPFFEDVDGDGHFSDVDCDDSDANIYPGAEESSCPDGADQDCDGIDGALAAPACPPIDADGDGFPSYYDCDDNVDWIHPGADEGACPDGTDQNCDGLDGDPDLVCNGMAEPVEPPEHMSA